MLVLDSNETYNYTELTNSYMRVFFSPILDRILTTNQTGYAHSVSGIDLNLFFKNLFTSLCLCTIQLTFFCVFRSKFKHLYQPRCCCVPVDERMDLLPEGYLSWILPTLKRSNNYYISTGLDAYFFVRFISIYLLFFIIVGGINILVLVPINWTSNNANYSAVGLDKLSLSNIANANVLRLNAHFIMGLITVGFFHWLVIYEFNSFIKIRRSYLLAPRNKYSIPQRTVLFSNVPSHLLDIDVITKLFDIIPGGIKTIWFLYDFKKIEIDVQQAQEALNILEKSHLLYLDNYLKTNIPSNLFYWLKGRTNDKLDAYIDQMNDPLEHDVSLESKFYPPIYFAPIKIPLIERFLTLRIPGRYRMLCFQKKVSMIDWALSTLEDKHRAIDTEKKSLYEGNTKKLDKIFIEFKSQVGASIVNQCLLSQNQGHLDSTVFEVHQEDVLWDNAARRNSNFALFERYLVSLIFICIIVLYVIPVSFIGLFSQIPMLTQLVPFLRWVYKIPPEARDMVSIFIPSILLAILTESVMISFRFLTYFKGFLSGCEMQLDLQKWYFAFLFVQQFLVVTILSSITVVFRQLIDQPTSIPILLATNLPKAATFFFQYITLKAFAFCGNNFLRIDQLILHLTLYRMKDRTPRDKFTRYTNLLKIKWGTVFPVYSVYVCIGIVYTIISPLISIFVVFILTLVLLYFKYALRYIYSHVNVSESYGKFYPVALFQTYAGIYCLECCLIGIFFLLKNEHGHSPLKIQGWIMIIVLLATIFVNITLYNRYIKHFTFFPILSDKALSDPEAVQILKDVVKRKVPKLDIEEEIDSAFYLDISLLYLHPKFKYEYPKIWLPADPMGLGDFHVDYFQARLPELVGGSTKGASVRFNKSYRSVTLSISEAPPDYK